MVEGFSGVPNNHLPPDDFKKFANLAFNTSDFKKMYWVKPVKDICEVSLSCMKGWDVFVILWEGLRKSCGFLFILCFHWYLIIIYDFIFCKRITVGVFL